MSEPYDIEPMFDPAMAGLDSEQAEVVTRARNLALSKFEPRAAALDREAIFPTENYQDLHASGLLAICVPKEDGGLGADFKTYMLAAAEIGRFCGATALTWNMHVCSCLWTGALADDLEMSPNDSASHRERRRRHYKRIVDEGAIYSQPFSEGGPAAAGAAPFSTKAVPVDGGWRITGKKIFASLAGHAHYYGILCGEMVEGHKPSRRDTMYVAVPANADGVRVVGDWDPLGMRATVSRTLLFEDVFVPADEALMPRGIYYQAATRWPHMFMTLSPAYMGIAQAAYDFTIQYLRGEVPGTPPVKRRMYPTKQLAVAEMHLMLESTKSLWLQAVREARPDPAKADVLRAYAAQHAVMENANELCQLALRTCGGQSMLKALPLERLYRDSRCGSLMLPWTAEICLDRIGREALYRPGETDLADAD